MNHTLFLRAASLAAASLFLPVVLSAQSPFTFTIPDNGGVLTSPLGGTVQVNPNAPDPMGVRPPFVVNTNIQPFNLFSGASNQSRTQIGTQLADGQMPQGPINGRGVFLSSIGDVGGLNGGVLSGSLNSLQIQCGSPLGGELVLRASALTDPVGGALPSSASVTLNWTDGATGAARTESITAGNGSDATATFVLPLDATLNSSLTVTTATSFPALVDGRSDTALLIEYYRLVDAPFLAAGCGSAKLTMSPVAQIRNQTSGNLLEVHRFDVDEMLVPGAEVAIPTSVVFSATGFSDPIPSGGQMCEVLTNDLGAFPIAITVSDAQAGTGLGSGSVDVPIPSFSGTIYAQVQGLGPNNEVAVSNIISITGN